MNTARAGLNMAGDIWTSGNWWTRRLLIFAVLWHLATVGVGLIGVPVITILFMITVGSILAILAVWYGQPLIPILAAFTASGRTVIHWIMAVICFELVLGTYLSTVPVGTNWTTRGMAIVAIGAAVTAIGLKINNFGWKTPIAILWLKFIVLTLAIYAYGLMPDIMSASKESWHKWQGETAEKIRRGETVFALSAQSARPSASRPAPSQYNHTLTVRIYPDRDSQVVSVPWYMSFAYHSPADRLEFTFPSGKKIGMTKNKDIVLTHPNGVTEQLPSFPLRENGDDSFTLRGDGGTATISW